MSERDELAKIIEREYVLASLNGRVRDCYNAPADALLAAGYRKPRTITIEAELDALEDGTVVMDAHGEVARKLVYGWRVLVSESGFDAWLSEPLAETYLPATVLYEPTA